MRTAPAGIPTWDDFPDSLNPHDHNFQFSVVALPSAVSSSGVTYSFSPDAQVPQGATIDASTGEVDWRTEGPSSPMTVDFQVRATDQTTGLACDNTFEVAVGIDEPSPNGLVAHWQPVVTGYVVTADVGSETSGGVDFGNLFAATYVWDSIDGGLNGRFTGNADGTWDLTDMPAGVFAVHYHAVSATGEVSPPAVLDFVSANRPPQFDPRSLARSISV